MSDLIINKVAESGIITLDPASFYPETEPVLLDLKHYLFRELILKEKEFRSALQETDWQAYSGKYVAVTCTTDAIIPAWAYMLIATYLQPVAKEVLFGDIPQALKILCTQKIDGLDVTQFQDKRVVIKGCGDLEIGSYAFLELTKKLVPVVKSLMYGEPCSTVPVYKKK